MTGMTLIKAERAGNFPVKVMAFKVLRAFKEFEIISLIDIVFLLLIFGLVVSLIGNLPPEDAEVPISDEWEKEYFSIRILYHANETQDSNAVEISYPDDGPVVSAYLPDDSLLLAMDYDDFVKLPACILIANHLEKYANNYLTEADESNPDKHIDIRVDQEIRFRIVGYIIRECSGYWKKISWLNLKPLG